MRYLRQADAYWQASGQRGRRVATLNNLGMLALDDNNPVAARDAFETALAIAQETGHRREEIAVRWSLADIELGVGRLDAAAMHFAAAYELARRLHLPTEAGAVGAFWTTVLAANEPEAARWRARIDPAAVAPEVHGRWALAQAVQALRAPVPDSAALAQHLAVAAAYTPTLQPLERAVLTLLQAQMEHQSSGALVASAQAGLVRAVEALPEVVLVRLSPHLRPALALVAPALPHLAALSGVHSPLPARRWRVEALGHFHCQVDERTCNLSALHRTILVRLLEAGPGGIAQERLWEDVWGDDDLKLAALRKAVSRLREETELPVVIRAGHYLIEDAAWAQVSYDVATWEQALAQATDCTTLQAALDAYTGEFLPGATLRAVRWVDGRRAYLQQRYLDALEELGRQNETVNPALALRSYQRVLHIDSCREQTALRLMHLAAQFGNHRLIATTYQQVCNALQAMGIPPSDAFTRGSKQFHR